MLFLHAREQGAEDDEVVLVHPIVAGVLNVYIGSLSFPLIFLLLLLRRTSTAADLSDALKYLVFVQFDTSLNLAQHAWC